MSKKKPSIASAAAGEDHAGQLSVAVEALTIQVEALTRQVEVLRQVLHEIREDFQWALQNDKFRPPRADAWRPVVHITSLPKDPCAKDWEINRVKPQDLPPDPSSTPTEGTPTRQAGLFD